MHLHLVRVAARPKQAPRPAKVVASRPAARRGSRRRDPSGSPRGRPLETRSRPLAHGLAAPPADVAEPEYAPVSETGGHGHEGSTPSVRT